MSENLFLGDTNYPHLAASTNENICIQMRELALDLVEHHTKQIVFASDRIEQLERELAEHKKGSDEAIARQIRAGDKIFDLNYQVDVLSVELAEAQKGNTPENKTIECEEFYELMMTYRASNPIFAKDSYQAVIDYVDVSNADRIEQLEGMLTQEQNRAGRIGTHSDDCHTWGHQHYECLLRKFEEAKIGHARYEGVRKLNRRQFVDIYVSSITGGIPFDDQVDAAIQESK